MVNLNVRRPGAPKAEPFTVLVLANPCLEAPLDTGQFIGDPIMLDPAKFANAALYIEQSLFGQLAQQAETMLGHPTIAPNVRFATLFDATLPRNASHSFVSQDSMSTMLVARRKAIRDFLLTHNLIADVVYAVSDSASHKRASAWYTTDDDTSAGTPFTLDQTVLHHRQRYSIPGTIGIHSSATSLTAVHEFSHAISSYTNGKVDDLYRDGGPALNIKRQTPIPPVPQVFAHYNGAQILSKQPGNQGWGSYHSALSSPNGALPALMDNYWRATPPEACEHDVITRQFIRDRVLAKMGRP